MSDAQPARFRSKVIGTGGYAPPNVVTNDDMAKRVDTSDAWITSRTGIKARRLIRYEGEMGTVDMAEHAAREALGRAGLSALDLDLIIVATVTPDMRLPSAACLLQDRIGAKRAAAFDVVAACAGSLFALSVADRFIRSGGAKNVLVIGGETLSAITDWQDRNTCVLFGDAAGAFVVQAVPDAGNDAPGFIDIDIYSDGSSWGILNIPKGGSKSPLTAQDLEERKDRIYMNGREVYKVAVRALVESAETILADHGYTTKDIGLVVAHQANLRIIEGVAQRLDVSLSQFVLNIESYGNTSAASALITFDEALRDGRMKPGQLVLMLAIGAGMCWSAGLYRV